jgi:hypothetical protein
METEIMSYLFSSSVNGDLDNAKLQSYNQESVSVKLKVTELIERKVVGGLPQPEATRHRIEKHTVPKGLETQL